MFCKADWTLVGIIAATSVLSTSFLRSNHLKFEQFSGIFEPKFVSEESTLKKIENHRYILLNTFTYLVGWIFGWPLSNSVGRKWSIAYSNILRLLSLVFYVIGMCRYAIFKETKATIQDFLRMAQLCESYYSGISFLLGPLYVYEIMPAKPSADLGTISAASGISLYFFLTNFAEYLKYATLPPLLIEPYWNYPWWCIAGVVLGVSTILQTVLFAKYFPESAFDLIIQGNQPQEAREAESMIPTVSLNVSEVNLEASRNLELHETQRDSQVRDCRIRCGFLMMLFFLSNVHFYLIRNQGRKVLY